MFEGNSLTASTGLSTGSLAPPYQFDAWHEWFWPLLDVSAPPRTGIPFPATNKVWDLGGLVVSIVSAPAVKVTRTKANIAKAPVDHWVLSCCRRGETTIRKGGVSVKAPPGVPFVWSLGENFETERTEVDRIQIFLPRAMFQDIAAPLDALRGNVIDSPMGSILGEYLLALEQWLPKAKHGALPSLGLSVRWMIAACLAPSAGRLAIADDELSGLRAERLRQAVQKHLNSPSLGPDMLCKMLGVSRSGLYRLFENSGGVVRYIQRQRLVRAYALLADPGNRQTVRQVSETMCFSDGASFSRAFKQEFGCRPRDVRSPAVNGGIMPSIRQPRHAAVSANFVDFLRSTAQGV
jgi:AraC-like DNA-binding protein